MSTYRGPHRRQVLVGVDGSAPSRAALHLAIREAGLRGGTLVALMSVSARRPHPAGSTPDPGVVESGQHTLRALLASVGTGGLEVDPVVTVAPAGWALVDRSAEADLLILGSPRSGGIPQDSVAMWCLCRARCPVVVVRPESTPPRAYDPEECAEEDSVARYL